MVRPQLPTVNQFFPPKSANGHLNLVSARQQCLSLLKDCSSPKQLSQIHARIQIFGLHREGHVVSELVRFCALSPSGNLSYARHILCHSDDGSVPFSWNCLIRGYAANDSPREAILVYLAMRSRGTRPNHYTFPFLLKACAQISALQEGRQVQMFDEISCRTLVSWNAIITACVENLWLYEAIEIFIKMRKCGFDPDETTMVVLLSACAELGNLTFGRWVHSQVIESGMTVNCQLGTALVDMYAKCGAARSASLVFNGMRERNVWTWSAMILGLAQHGFSTEALELFSKMMKSSVSPNYVTFLGVLCACSHAGLVDDGYQFFHVMKSVHKIRPMMVHYGAMVDILGRAGRFKEAYTFIMNMPIEPDSIVWRTLLSACSIHNNVNDRVGVEEKVRKRLLELEPRRGENFVMVANLYAEVGMWEKAANVRKIMRDGGLKKMAGESCIEVGGFICRFFSGNDSQVGCESVYQLLDGLNFHMKTACCL
ncbi:pentatricopeptide repeat-containing protein At2g36730 isoform X2 [Malania oleifera]|uniref:pentatricopeptide repeat-containing protein At2g36730 isoform X2 n=1 Tax=Malania oleifera TaxID=397392 RepID=UPI0025ADCCF0|nr:pentatricopeptide repeat-containing protein At2g36730 isoform X2 [Malania oleifera]